MRKTFLGILAISTVTLAQTSGDIAVKITNETSNFKGGTFGVELNGKASFDYDINIEGNIYLSQSYKGELGISLPEDFKSYDFSEVTSTQGLVNNSLGKLLLKDTYLKISKGFEKYGLVELKQKGIYKTGVSYSLPVYNNSKLEILSKAGYSIDYSDYDKTVNHRGDLDAIFSYELQKGLKLNTEVGISVSNISYDVVSTELVIKGSDVAIIPKVSLGVDYKDGKGLETGAKISYQKEVLGLDFDLAYDISSKQLGVKNLSLRPAVKISSSNEFIVPKSFPKKIYVEKYFKNYTILTAKLDLEYMINRNLSFVSNVKVKNTLDASSFYVKDENVKAQPVNISSEPSISVGLKYNF